MSETIAVDSLFDPDGRIHIRRIKLDDHWLSVEQGRQWLDEHGRHILIIIPGHDVQEILLSSDSLQWRLMPRQGASSIA